MWERRINTAIDIINEGYKCIDRRWQNIVVDKGLCNLSFCKRIYRGNESEGNRFQSISEDSTSIPAIIIEEPFDYTDCRLPMKWTTLHCCVMRISPPVQPYQNLQLKNRNLNCLTELR